MKKITFIGLLLLLFISGFARERDNSLRKIRISDFELVQEPGTITLDFTMHIGRKATRNNHNLTVIPILTDGNTSRELSPVVIRGRQAKLLYDRRAIASPRTFHGYFQNDTLVTRNGETVPYSVTLPYSDWMAEANLLLDGIDEGCCSETRTRLGLIARNPIAPESEFYSENEILISGPILSTGDRLAAVFPFVKPAGEDKAFDELSRDSMITLYFRQGRHNIERGYRRNHEALIDILSVIRGIEDSKDSRIDRIVIIGFASPEGGYELNLNLSERRAENARQFILDNTRLRSDQFSIHIGGEDWTGLRRMVAASDMPERYVILDIIDKVPLWEPETGYERETELKRLRDGKPYQYMLRNFFPELRNATYITVYYRNE